MRPATAGVETSALHVFDIDDVRQATCRLRTWIEGEQFKGWDPYDGMNSPLAMWVTLGRRLPGVIWVQLLKNLPWNLRPLLGIKKGYNPKGIGLLMSSYLRMYQVGGSQSELKQVESFADWLIAHRSAGYSGSCWGYNFHWPNRNFNAPMGTPTLVNTVFVGQAFLDGYEICKRPEWLEIARSACSFILDDLHRQESDKGICFSYTPLDRRPVHNANILGAAFLARVAKLTGDKVLLTPASAAAQYTVTRQRPDGSWPYGDNRVDGWVDGYHTGMTLNALADYADYCDSDNDDVIQRCLRLGYNYYREHLIEDGHIPRWSSVELYPVDIHCVSQAILTFCRFRTLEPEAVDAALKVARWGMTHMMSRQGYFFYQLRSRYSIRIPYMRWSQAWMFKALVELMWVLDSA